MSDNYLKIIFFSVLFTSYLKIENTGKGITDIAKNLCTVDMIKQKNTNADTSWRRCALHVNSLEQNYKLFKTAAITKHEKKNKI